LPKRGGSPQIKKDTPRALPENPQRAKRVFTEQCKPAKKGKDLREENGERKQVKLEWQWTFPIICLQWKNDQTKG